MAHRCSQPHQRTSRWFKNGFEWVKVYHHKVDELNLIVFSRFRDSSVTTMRSPPWIFGWRVWHDCPSFLGNQSHRQWQMVSTPALATLVPPWDVMSQPSFLSSGQIQQCPLYLRRWLVRLVIFLFLSFVSRGAFPSFALKIGDQCL